MSVDEALDAAERAFREAPDAGARLRFARALRRAGREEEAGHVLRGGLDDAEVRREAVAAAAGGGWTHRRGGAGGARWIDAAPVRRAPRVRWRRPLAEAWTGSPTDLIVGACGVVATTQEHVTVLDPEDGTPRWRARWARGPGRSPVVVDDVLLVPSGAEWLEDAELAAVPVDAEQVVGYDLWTGEELHRTRLGGIHLRHAGGRLFCADAGGPSCWELPDPRQPPRRSWAAEPREGARVVLLASERAVAWTGVRIEREQWPGQIYAADTGEELAQVPRFQAGALDERGLLSLHETGRPHRSLTEPLYDSRTMVAAGSIQERATRLCDLDGNVLWERPNFRPEVLAPTWAVLGPLRPAIMVMEERSELHNLIVDRRTARPLARLPANDQWTVAARDVIYLGRGERIEAWSLAGERLWSWSAPDQEKHRAHVTRGVPAAGRFYAVTFEGTVFCLEEETLS